MGTLRGVGGRQSSAALFVWSHRWKPLLLFWQKKLCIFLAETRLSAGKIIQLQSITHSKLIFLPTISCHRVQFCDDLAKLCLSPSGCFSPPTATVAPPVAPPVALAVAPPPHDGDLNLLRLLSLLAGGAWKRFHQTLLCHYFSFRQGLYFEHFDSSETGTLHVTMCQ